MGHPRRRAGEPAPAAENEARARAVAGHPTAVLGDARRRSRGCAMRRTCWLRRLRASLSSGDEGISGDEPIVLVRVHDPEAPLLVERLAAQRYLRSCGVRLELVLVDELATGYASEGSGYAAQRTRHGTTRRLRRPARRHIRARGRSSPRRGATSPRGERARRTRYARLARCAEPGHEPPGEPRLPHFEPTLVETVPARRGRAPTSCSTMEPAVSRATAASTCSRCRRAADAGAVVQRDRERRSSVVSSASRHSGATWSLNSGENRLTPWRNDPVLDTPVRGPVPQGRGDCGGLVADATSRRPRRRDARPPRCRIHEVRVRSPRPRADDDGVCSARCGGQGRAAARQEHARQAPAADRDVLRGVGARQPARRAAAVYRVRGRSHARVCARDVQLERGVRRARRVSRFDGRGARLHDRPHRVPRPAR